MGDLTDKWTAQIRRCRINSPFTPTSPQQCQSQRCRMQCRGSLTRQEEYPQINNILHSC